MTIMDRFRLDDKVVVVTGASSGLGVALARGLAEAGADIGLGARRVERLEETRQLVESVGRRAVTVATDVSDPIQCQRLVDMTVSELGAVDVLINNAGVGTAVPATRETPDAFRATIEVNLCGSYWMAQACVRVMKPGSSIINVSSVLAMTTGGLPQAAYTSSKAGVLGLTRDLAQQWTGRKGIRVNALVPGFFASEMTAQYTDAYVESVRARVPAGRWGEPDELVAAALFLASDASSYVTGAALPVDGGFLIT